MKRFLIALSPVLACSFVLVGVAIANAADDLSDEERQTGYVSLFNGKDLTNWRFGEESPPEKMPDNWKVEEGVIKVTGGGSPHLASAKEYADFEFRFEWRGMKPKYNSGLFIRSGKKVGANQINLASGGEGNFLGGKLPGAKPVPKLQKPAGEWNEWRIRCVGEKITFHCNGELAWKATGFATKSGYIGLQAEGAPLEFRKLRILEIK
jgi:hypothetical protein